MLKSCKIQRIANAVTKKNTKQPFLTLDWQNGVGGEIVQRHSKNCTGCDLVIPGIKLLLQIGNTPESNCPAEFHKGKSCDWQRNQILTNFAFTDFRK